MNRLNPINNTFGGVVKQTALSKFYGLSMLDRIVAFLRALITGEPVQVKDRPLYITPSGRFLPVIAGGDGTEDFVEAVKKMAEKEDSEVTAEEIAAIESLARIADLSDDELAELQPVLRALADKVKEEDSDDAIAMLNQIADQIDVVKGEESNREQAAQKREEDRQAALARINAEEPTAEETENEEPVAETPEENAEVEGEPGTETPEEAPAEPEAEAPVEEPVAASAPPKPTRPSAGSMNRTKPASAKPKASSKPKATLVAAGDVYGFSAGQEIDDFDKLGVAFHRKAEALMRTGKPTSSIVASLDISDLFPEERVLYGDRDDERKIEAVTSPQAIIAAGGICAPIEAAYDVEGISTDVRPLRDALARFNARTGGIRFVPPITLNDADVVAAVGLWPESLDASPGNATKAIATLDCGDEQEVRVGAVTARVSAGNFLRRFAPNRFRQFWEEVRAFHARVAENDLYRQLQEASLTLTVGQTLGTARDVLAVLDRAVAGFKSRHRMPTNATLRFFAPDWLRAQMRADLARQMPGDNTLAVADAEIDRFFAARNVNVTWLLDARQSLGMEVDGSALNGWPTSVSTILTHEGAFTFLDGGTLDLGLEIRDTSTNETNDAEAFVETFEAVAFRGHESDELILDVCPSGEASGLADTTGAICNTGS